jgi:phosphonate transport system substrate-binding protein
MVIDTFNSCLFYSISGDFQMITAYSRALLWLFLYSFSLTISAQEAVPEKTYTVGIVPQHSASKVIRIWAPLFDQISSSTGYNFKVITSKDIPEFEKKLESSTYDFAYMNPYHFVVYNNSPGYRALAKQKNKEIHGIIVTQKTSEIVSLKQLSGEKIAFPSPGSFAASILTRGSLLKEGISFEPVYVSSHDSVYKTVSKGFFTAGGGVVRTLKNMDEKTQKNIRILWKSPGYTPHAFAVNPNVPKKVAQSFQQALVDIINDDSKIILNNLGMHEGFVKAVDKDWDDVRELKIGLNSVKIK